MNPKAERENTQKRNRNIQFNSTSLKIYDRNKQNVRTVWYPEAVQIMK